MRRFNVQWKRFFAFYGVAITSVIVLVVLAPIVTGWVVKLRIFVNVGTQTDWINYSGGYTGGVIAGLSGAIIAYFVTKWQLAGEKQRDMEQWEREVQARQPETIGKKISICMRAITHLHDATIVLNRKVQESTTKQFTSSNDYEQQLIEFDLTAVQLLAQPLYGLMAEAAVLDKKLYDLLNKVLVDMPTSYPSNVAVIDEKAFLIARAELVTNGLEKIKELTLEFNDQRNVYVRELSTISAT